MDIVSNPKKFKGQSQVISSAVELCRYRSKFLVLQASKHFNDEMSKTINMVINILNILKCKKSANFLILYSFLKILPI